MPAACWALGRAGRTGADPPPIVQASKLDVQQAADLPHTYLPQRAVGGSPGRAGLQASAQHGLLEAGSDAPQA